MLARYRAHGVYLSGDSTEYNFTENNDKEKKYVYVKDISYISSGSSQSGYAAKNMIDASPFTTWHTTWGQVAKDKTYVVSFNKENIYHKLPMILPMVSMGESNQQRFM